MTSPEQSGDRSAEASEWTTLAGFGICTTYLIFLVATHLREGGAAMTLPHENALLDMALIPARSLGLAGAYLLASCFCGLFLLLWMKKKLQQLPRRAIGLPLLILALSSLVALIEGGSSVWGGLFGEMLRDGYEMYLPRSLAYLLAIGLVFFGMFMARDWFFFDELRRFVTNQPAAPAFAVGMGDETPEVQENELKTMTKKGRVERQSTAPSFELGAPISLDATAELMEMGSEIATLGTGKSVVDDLGPMATDHSVVIPQPTSDAEALEKTDTDEIPIQVLSGESSVPTETQIEQAAVISEAALPLIEEDEELRSFLIDDDDDDDEDPLNPVPQLDWSTTVSEDSDVDLFGVMTSVEDAAELDHAEEDDLEESLTSSDSDDKNNEDFPQDLATDLDDDEFNLAADDLLDDDELIDAEELEEQEFDDEEELEFEEDENALEEEETTLEIETEDDEYDDELEEEEEELFEQEYEEDEEDDEESDELELEEEATLSEDEFEDEEYSETQDETLAQDPPEFGVDTQALLDADLDDLFEEDENPVYAVEDYANKQVEAEDRVVGLDEVNYETSPPVSFDEDEIEQLDGDLVDEPEEVEIQHLLFEDDGESAHWEMLAPTLDGVTATESASLPEEEEAPSNDDIPEASELERYGKSPAVSEAKEKESQVALPARASVDDDDWAPWGEDSTPPRPAFQDVAENTTVAASEIEVPQEARGVDDDIDWIDEEIEETEPVAEGADLAINAEIEETDQEITSKEGTNIQVLEEDSADESEVDPGSLHPEFDLDDEEEFLPTESEPNLEKTSEPETPL